MKKLVVSILFILGLFSSTTKAEVLVFVHGYDSSSQVWRNTEILPYLQTQAWQDAGNITYSNGLIDQQVLKLQPYRMVTVDLPSAAPIPLQARVLSDYLHYLQKQDPAQDFTLIGHSIGGIVARFMLVHMSVHQLQLKIKRLITIASPHMGTGMAEAAELIAKTPVSILAPIVDADIINYSKILLKQLQRAEPGTFLFWLNHQKHPDINYVSIIRSSGAFFNKDYYVPSNSQDLRIIPAIRSIASHKIRAYPSRGKHQLSFSDAHLIAYIVGRSAN